MDVTGKEEAGKVEVSTEVIATISGAAAVECFGLVGMVSRNLKEGLGELLGRDDLSKGVEVRIDGENVYIDLFIVVSYGVNIAQVAQNVMQKVRYQVEILTGLSVKEVNVNVQGVRVTSKQ